MPKKPDTDPKRKSEENTPANSPSENLRRSSMGRATVVTFRDSEDKENGKDQNWKQMRVRSPTISAASKVTTSPRKKILAERNELVRASSVSFSDLKSSCLNPRVEDPEHTKVGLAPHLVFTTPSFKISPPPCCPKSSPIIAPLDDDPAAHPYDPKTNYLSPRPQFLH